MWVSHALAGLARVLLFLSVSGPALATGKFVPPPRTAVDIDSLLAHDKPTSEKLTKLRAEADAPEPRGRSKADLAAFYFERAQARGALGNVDGATADGLKSLDLAKSIGDPTMLAIRRQFVAIQYLQAGEPKRSLEQLRLAEREVNVPGVKGFLFPVYALMASQLVSLGDFDGAQAVVRRSQNLYRDAQANWGESFALRKTFWSAQVERARAIVFDARGQHREAEQAYTRSIDLMRQWIEIAPRTPNPPSRIQMIQIADAMVGFRALARSALGRTAEAEADVRQAIINELKVVGKYNLVTMGLTLRLGAMLMHQGRYTDAAAIFRQTVDTLDTLGVKPDSGFHALAVRNLANTLNLQGKWEEANRLFGNLEANTQGWDEARKDAFGIAAAQVLSYFNSNNIAAGIPAAQRLLKRQTTRYGDQHVETALARGLYAIGLLRADRVEEAGREFAQATPILISTIRNSSDDDRSQTAARDQRIQNIAEANMNLLARMGGPEAAEQTFQLADVVRSQAVQRALAASTARAGARDPAMAALVRRQQDLEKEVAAQIGVLNNALAAPPTQRDEKAIKVLQAEIARLTVARDKARTEISTRFADFGALVSPDPPTIADIRKSLRPGEAFLSFYFGKIAGFVWAIPQDGPVGFARIPFGIGDLERKVGDIRAALEPNAVSMLDIPPFDLKAAHELYLAILKPVERSWGSARSLIVAAHGALGLLPLGLLPTEPAPEAAPDGPLFANYRNVQWLARKYAVATVPSAAAFRTLRGAPPASADNREMLIGFGDPVFKPAAAADAPPPQTTPDSIDATRGLPLRRRAGVTTRGADAADLSQLPPLPDTADELRAIAAALAVDPATTLHLGVDANEKTVAAADLAKYRIVAFATHGLLPGDLDGLTQPALALTAPAVARVDGDGLLTMEKILGLRLNADWVLLSACNSGAASSAGAEAASGLGRAFFYAGARALLVTNWSVHSASARELVSDVFLRMQAEPGLDRAEALRRASIRLVDEGGQRNADGRLAFSYAHPLFWAPYSIVGEAGR